LFKIIKYTELSYCKDGYTWSICPYSGSLIKDETTETIKISLPEKVADALRYCNSPYLCQPYDTIFHKKLEINKDIFIRLNRMHRIFVYLSNKRFFLSKQYASFRNLLFPTTTEAIMAISQIALQREQMGKFCLQRTLLALKTSKSFQENGVLFIGALLPTTNMHAWIIENGTQPDIYDREWIHYRPLLAFY
jgi:hypothetical protein